MILDYTYTLVLDKLIHTSQRIKWTQVCNALFTISTFKTLASHHVSYENIRALYQVTYELCNRWQSTSHINVGW